MPAPGEPYLIGMAGPSCAGKTEIARSLARRLAAPLLPLDHYYRDLGRLPLGERERKNFDDPAMLDWELLRGHIESLRQGREILKPVYDFTRHTRTSTYEEIRPASVVVVEGLYALWDAEIRACFSLRVFVSLADEICFARRLERDMRERGRGRESVLRQYEETVRPMCQLHVMPTRDYAEVVVLGDQPVEQSAEMILKHVALSPVRL